MDVRGRRLLIFGDSHAHRGARTAPDGVQATSERRSGSPGDILGSRLLDAGAATVRINGRVSRSAVNLFNGRGGENGTAVLAAEAAYKPDLVVVALGTNDIGLSAPADEAGFRRIAQAFPNVTLVAIGPPSFSRRDLTDGSPTVYATLRKVFGEANVIDARPLTADLTTAAHRPDGVHFNSTGARLFADRLATALLNGKSTTTVVAPSPSPSLPAPSSTRLRFVGLAAVGAFSLIGLALWVRRRRGDVLRGADALPSSERQHVPRAIDPEIDDAVERAVAAGAIGPLEYKGAGMEGIVFCDAHDSAFKVGRTGGGSLAESAAFLRKANQVPGVKERVVRFKRFDVANNVVVTECVRGRVGGWKDESKLFDLTQDIKKAMIPYGFTAPEMKGDSWVFARGRGPILVDVGFAARVGAELVKHVLDVLNGRVPRGPWESNEMLALDIRRERNFETIPPSIANRLLVRLGADPSD